MILRVPDGQGGYYEVPAIKGDKGDPGDKGTPGDKGDPGEVNVGVSSVEAAGTDLRFEFTDGRPAQIVDLPLATTSSAGLLAAEDKANILAVPGLEISVHGSRVRVPVTGAVVKDHDANYKLIRDDHDNPLLRKGIEYVLVLTPSVSLALTSQLQMGNGPWSAGMVDTLAPEGTQLTAGEPFEVTYTPSVDGLYALRLVGNVTNIPTVNIYTTGREGGLTDEVSNLASDVVGLTEDISGFTAGADAGGTHHLARKINGGIAELRALQNEVDSSLASLTQVQLSEGATQNITVAAPKSRLLRVGLHYGPSRYTPSDTEIFFDGQSRKDFTDVRFFDAAGNMLKAQLGEHVNLELLEDDNLTQVVKVTNSGALVGYRNGITLSTDNGATFSLIPGTTDVTTNGSAQYNRTSMYPIYVDSGENIFAYAGGVLYKLLASDGYATKSPVLDFSWEKGDGATAYPDFQDHAMDADSNGVLFASPYHVENHTVIYRSTDGGESFDVAWSSIGDVSYQHPHHIHGDPYSNRLYVGVDDGGRTFNGAHILVTEDGGETWGDITDGNHDIRGRDYYPTYFGEGYRLGGGESYYNGGGTVYRSEDDENYTIPVKGIAGVRSYADFGTDDLILAGVQQVRGNSENQIILSEDQGKTWKTIYRKWNPPAGSSGMGYRASHGAALLQGDTEPCIILTKDHAPHIKSMRVYQGGDHYYREAFILLDEATSGPVAITAKTGYMMGYPYNSVNDGGDRDGLVYRVPLNEGAGRLVSDSSGNAVRIAGNDYEWDNSEEPRRFGDYSGENAPRPLVPSAGLMLKQGTTLNFGKIPELDFNHSFTVTFWINPNGLLMDEAEYNRRPNTLGILSAGDIALFNRNNTFGYTKRDATHDSLTSAGYEMMRVGINGYAFSDQYFFVAIAVNADGAVQTYINGTDYTAAPERQNSFTMSRLADGDFVIGSDLMQSAGYLSEISVYSRVIGADEILGIYRGV